jgi:cysteine sulfinate desulfinase/cysteine desulfurase-like protein
VCWVGLPCSHNHKTTHSRITFLAKGVLGMEPNNLYVLLVLCMLQKQKKLHIHTLKYQDTTIHETIHELHRRKKSAIILKIDFEKPYDKVK